MLIEKLAYELKLPYIRANDESFIEEVKQMGLEVEEVIDNYYRVRSIYTPKLEKQEGFREQNLPIKSIWKILNIVIIKVK